MASRVLATTSLTSTNEIYTVTESHHVQVQFVPGRVVEPAVLLVVHLGELVHDLLGACRNAAGTVQLVSALLTALPQGLFHVHHLFVVLVESVGQGVQTLEFEETGHSSRAGEMGSLHGRVQLVDRGRGQTVLLFRTMIVIQMGVDVHALDFPPGHVVTVMGDLLPLLFLLLCDLIRGFPLDLVHLALHTSLDLVGVVGSHLFSSVDLDLVFLAGCTDELVVVDVLDDVVVLLLLHVLLEVVYSVHLGDQLLLLLDFDLLVVGQVVVLQDALEIV